MLNNIQNTEDSDLDALFNGETLTEDFKKKAKLIFETALQSKVYLIEKNILESSLEVLQEEIITGVNVGIETGMTNLTEMVDQYLTYVGQEWLAENKLEVESGFRTEISENFIYGLKKLFENSFIEVPEEKSDLVNDLFEEKEKIENDLNEAIKQNIELRSALTAQLCVEQFVNISQDLTDTQIEKLATLVEGISFDSIEQYAEKVKVLKESYFGVGSATNTQEIEPQVSRSESSALMENYVSAISRQLKISNYTK